MKSFRFIVIGILILAFNVIANAQACGYVFLTLYLKDSKGDDIKNAKVEFFDSKFKNQKYLFLKGNMRDNTEKSIIQWNADKQAFYGVEGMCSGHRNVGVRIKSKWFKTFEFVEHFTLGWHSFLINLKKDKEIEKNSKIKLATVRGNISGNNNSSVIDADIYLTQDGSKTIQKVSKNGFFLFDIPKGIYKIEFVPKNNFKSIVLEKEDLEEGSNYLDIKIKEEK